MHEYSKLKIDWDAYYQKDAEFVEFNTSEDTHASRRNDFALSKFPNNLNSVLDVGCGNGFLLQELRKRNKKIGLTGIDISVERISKICLRV